MPIFLTCLCWVLSLFPLPPITSGPHFLLSVIPIFPLILPESSTHSYKLYFLAWQGRSSGLNLNVSTLSSVFLITHLNFSKVELFGLPKQIWSLLTNFHAISFPYDILAIPYGC